MTDKNTQTEQCTIPSVMHWVAVEDRLPNEHEDVMVYCYGNRKSKHFPNLQFMKQSSFYNGEFECTEDVTHWAELPEPPCA
jgi:hypothetical protein